MGYVGNTHTISEEKPEGNRPPGKSRRRWEGNIKMELREFLNYY
jgi:hypothetical protein